MAWHCHWQQRWACARYGWCWLEACEPRAGAHQGRTISTTTHCASARHSPLRVPLSVTQLSATTLHGGIAVAPHTRSRLAGVAAAQSSPPATAPRGVVSNHAGRSHATATAVNGSAAETVSSPGRGGASIFSTENASATSATDSGPPAGGAPDAVARDAALDGDAAKASQVREVHMARLWSLPLPARRCTCWRSFERLSPVAGRTGRSCLVVCAFAPCALLAATSATTACSYQPSFLCMTVSLTRRSVHSDRRFCLTLHN